MSYRNRFLSLVTTCLALAANACSGSVARPVESAVPGALVCAGGTVHSEAEAARYAACGTVRGDLRIAAPELTDLSAFAGLRSVTGTLEITGNSQLDDLSGLDRLAQVGTLLVHDNQDLDDLVGLQNLTRAERVVISGNPELATLHGLESLQRVDQLLIEHNGLYRTTGISALREVGDLVIRDNHKLNSLYGFRSLGSARSIEIVGNPRLCARGMLPALQRVEHKLSVQANRGLSKPDVSALLGRVESGVTSEAPEAAPQREASL